MYKECYLPLFGYIFYLHNSIITDTAAIHIEGKLYSRENTNIIVILSLQFSVTDSTSTKSCSWRSDHRHGHGGCDSGSDSSMSGTDTSFNVLTSRAGFTATSIAESITPSTAFYHSTVDTGFPTPTTTLLTGKKTPCEH